MAIQDTDAERRNLSVTSIAFIAYFAGGGFVDGAINLGVINATFSKPKVLAVMAWVILLWFFYRYWVTHKKAFSKAYWSEINELKNHSIIRRYVNQNLPQDSKLLPLINKEPNNDEDKGFVVDSMKKVDKAVVVVVDHADKVERSATGEISSYHMPKGLKLVTAKQRGDIFQEIIEFNDLSGKLVLICINAIYCFNFRSFSDYIVPYVLFLLVLVLAFDSWLSSLSFDYLLNFCFLKD